MHTHCKRIYSAMPMHCQRICNGRCETPCVSDASTETRDQRPDLGVGLDTSNQFVSPSPVVRDVVVTRSSAQREVWHHLTAGLGWLSANDHGRPWPLPRRDRLASLLAEFDEDLCVAAAREAREIVQSQDRAPNITALFEKKLRDLASVRTAVRGALADVGEGEPCL